MAGINDNVAIVGEWVPPSPSPRAFFSAILGDDIGSRTMPGPFTEKKTEGLFVGLPAQMPARNTNLKDLAQNGFARLNESGPCTEQRLNSRGGLVERMAARAGFNAPRLNTESIRSAELLLNSEVQSPYLTISPGLSPTTLLESPVFLTNSLAQPSPTTGKFSFFPSGNCKSAPLDSEPPIYSKDSFFEDSNPSSFAFKPVLEQSSFSFGKATSKTTPTSLPQPSFPSIEVSLQSENTLPSHGTRAMKIKSQVGNTFQFPAELSSLTPEKDNGVPAATDRRVFDSISTVNELSPPLEELLDEEGDLQASGDSILRGGGGTFAKDGYNWRKYGQKQVKGSEYPRSYYKCTQTNCPVKKKVEHSHEGHITEIIYQGVHNHLKPLPPKRSALGSLNPTQLDGPELVELPAGSNTNQVWASVQKELATASHDHVEVTSSASVGHELGSSTQVQNGSHLESGDVVDASSTFSNDEDDDDDRATHGSIGYEGEEDECELKRRKIETYATDMGGASRAIREPRVVVQTTSEVDILDDGYRWRKYGQKVVKGNPNPRSYYKCTSTGCTVRKHVERASHDLKSVITTYEGKHNHDVPAARNSSHVNSCSSVAGTAQAAAPLQTHVQRPEPSQVQHNVAGSEGTTAAFGSFGLPGRQQLGPVPSFSFGMNQPGLACLTMAGLGPGQAKMPVMTAHPYLAQRQRSMNEMGFMFPGGEPKVEPVSEHSMNLPNDPSVYQQMMSRHPQM